ncbi:DUF202 domain-containing protein [Microbulbifer flavimaris]|uniref:DUF202 domain-containing protein n=1 Tax=Microbulbifer flavimaris TaxID=1781068 RepID=A0ABX4I359_9GAMM|nr:MULTISPECIES: DUF202 domain-containing protein [Microbulbifer]KUJ84760.1 hypothetical protein AVO43_03685 [Microbulbifer sp. ZGT114]PCO06854.1 DUF202 domain-containing protein [Microbulbifer flavimaris]
MATHFTEHAANERTFLAWVRTAIAVVGFGLAAGRISGQPPSYWSEVALVVAGGFVILLSYLRMRRQRWQIDRDAGLVDEARSVDLLLVGLLFSLFALIVFFARHLI